MSETATSKPLTVFALLLTMFMAAMEMTVVSTAMPTVVGDLGGVQFYSWVFAAYMLVSTVTVPVYGKLADLYGRKPVLLFGLALFLLGSTLSGQAQSMTGLIVFRAIQGLGAGAMQPISMTIIGDLFTIAQRARMQGLFGAVWGLAGIAGPALGGFIVEQLSWRWVFYINVPFGLTSAAILAVSLHEKVERHERKLDIPGALVLTLGITALLAGARGGALGIAGLVLGAALIAGFLMIERTAAEPLLPLDLFRRPIMAVSSATGALLGACMISTVTFVPLYAQGVLHLSPTGAAWAIMPMLIGWPVASTLSGRLLPRLGARALVRAGLVCAAAAELLLALLLRPEASVWIPRGAMLLLGTGLGLSNTALIIAVQSSVAWRQRGVATASTMFFRTIGGTLAVGLLGGILAAALAADPQIPASAADQLLGPTHGHDLGAAVLALLDKALVVGLERIFWILFAISLAAGAIGLLLPHVELSAPGEAGEVAATE